MKKILCFIVCLTTILGTSFAQSLNESSDLEKNVEFVENHDEPPPPAPSSQKPKQNPPKPKANRKPVPPKRNPPPRPSHDVDTFGDFLFETLFALSFVNNLIVDFDNYPYANSDYYIELLDSTDEDFPSRFCRFDAGTSLFYDPQNMMLNPYVRFDGYIYKFIGPLFENTNYIDFGDNNFYKGNFKLGIEMAIFQTYLFSLSWNIQYVHYYGNGQLNGLNLGFLIKSYPFEPMVLEYRFNASNIYDNRNYNPGPFKEDVVYEHYFECGFMLNSPIEILGCYKYIEDGIQQKGYHNFGLGIKYYF